MNDCDEESDPHEISPRHCTDCDILTKALRDAEQQCREAEDRRNLEVAASTSRKLSQLRCAEDAYLARMKKLEHRRNCALEVLLKHQSLEHR